MVKALPRLMVAMNGARKNKNDHPALPMSTNEIVSEATRCFAAGADGLHLHVRDSVGLHTLDSSIYKEVLDALAMALPTMDIQITTEAVGQYAPEEQRTLVEVLKPGLVSISIAEMTALCEAETSNHGDSETKAVESFYTQCVADNIAVQHILYSPDDVTKLVQLARSASLAFHGMQMLFVLGRYTQGQQSDPNTIRLFLERLAFLNVDAAKIDWAVCAFGQQETQCLAEAWRLGGKMRVGFENSFLNSNGEVARNNAQRVEEVVRVCELPSG